ncbi:cytochrome c biogenesis protein CcsB [Vibrio sp. MACH09]|uniref:c-type cytochrome n=2 Tax=unclassified Vibrio TaxID=2614977 RepID=UPI0014939DC9|nr:MULTISPECIES: cytochrome c [unclassified Vibrio]NOI66617.1 cytochrome c [Vibrio sp. 99-8-1]GLO60187.1 cytochrome c biogenesis protein CcsB [Vibrio sp. MACH09]
MNKITTGLLLATALFSASSMAAGDPVAGKAKSAICAACHGADGMALIDGYPNIKGQNSAYIQSSLKAYRSKQRNGGLAVVMQAQAMLLNDQDIENLAAYYSSLK